MLECKTDSTRSFSKEKKAKEKEKGNGLAESCTACRESTAILFNCTQHRTLQMQCVSPAGKKSISPFHLSG
jgi:hypothetical protein